MIIKKEISTIKAIRETTSGILTSISKNDYKGMYVSTKILKDFEEKHGKINVGDEIVTYIDERDTVGVAIRQRMVFFHTSLEVAEEMQRLAEEEAVFYKSK